MAAHDAGRGPGRFLLYEAFQASGKSLCQLWLDCVGLTGDADELEIDGYLHGLTGLGRHDRLVLVVAINEDRWDRGLQGLDPGAGEA